MVGNTLTILQVKSEKDIKDVQWFYPVSKTQLGFPHLGPKDLLAIKASTDKLLSAETKIPILFNNARLQTLDPDAGSTAPDYQKHLGL
ncbi:hypothetical protein ColTof4_09878 [Colletotrichum tofieldiae]|nr:hypothetical protein ColTof3_05237 [Colletotrichum tofieldiae]GKT77455.1 hypothetical protein ColTof4_09878 [Colletotrichum tofieldiae]GKT86142.1 hypothetical protein Ct61P_03992 [Colletotrichum tofieldiae]